MKLNQAEIRRNIYSLKGQVDQMLEHVVAMSNLQHVVTKNIGPPSGFTVVTNLMYDLPPDHALQQVPTEPQNVYIQLSNELTIMRKNPNNHIDEGVPNLQGTC